jgi:hypothetical protein
VISKRLVDKLFLLCVSISTRHYSHNIKLQKSEVGNQPLGSLMVDLPDDPKVRMPSFTKLV